MESSEKIKQAKISQKLEYFRNDLIIGIIFSCLIGLFIYQFEQSSKLDAPILKSVLVTLFYFFLFLKLTLNGFILNFKNDTKYIFFSSPFLFKSGEYLKNYFHFFGCFIYLFWLRKKADLNILQKAKLISNLLLIPILVLGWLVFTYSK